MEEKGRGGDGGWRVCSWREGGRRGMTFGC